MSGPQELTPALAVEAGSGSAWCRIGSIVTQRRTSPRAARRRVPESLGRGSGTRTRLLSRPRLRRGNRRPISGRATPLVADTVIFGTYRPERDLAGPTSQAPPHRPRRLKRRAGNRPHTTRSSTSSTGSSNRARTTLRLSSLGGPGYNPSAYGQPAAIRSAAAAAVRSVPAVRSAVSAAAQPISAARPYQPGQYRIRASIPSSRACNGAYPQPGAEESSKRSMAVIGTVVGDPGRDHRGGRAGARILEARVLRHHQARRRQGPAGVQQILTDETNGYGARNVKDVRCSNGQSPTVKKGATHLRGQHRQWNQASGDRDLPGRQGHLQVGRPKVAVD